MPVKKICIVLVASTLLWTGPTQTFSAQSTGWSTNGPEGGAIIALVSSPQDPATLYAATWNEGVFKTTDGGGRWINTGLLDKGVDALAIDPHASDTVYAGTYTGGVFKSLDGGGTWTAVNTGLTTGGALSLAIDPQVPATLYAGTINGIFKSTDGGNSWSAMTTWPKNSSVLSLAVDPQTSSTLYGGRSGDGGVVKSTDGGISWSDTGLTGHIYALAIDPQTPSIVYAATFGGGVYKSTDAGNSWTLGNAGLGGTAHYSLVINPQAPAILYAGTDVGVYKSADGGSNWNAVHQGPAGIGVLALAIDAQTPDNVYAGTFLSAASGWQSPIGVFKSTDGGNLWETINTGLVATSVHSVAIDPRNSDIVYAGTVRGAFKTSDGANSWSGVNNGLPAPPYIVAVDSQSPDTLYAVTSSGIFKSTNGGGSWSVANAGITNPFVDALAVARQDPNTLYVGTLDGLFKSTDGAASWALVDVGLGDNVRIFSVTIDPQVSSTVYATAFDTTRIYGGGTLKSTDGGATWTMVSQLFLIVAVDPQTPTILYGANFQGVFKSTDGGASWNAVNTGLPPNHGGIDALAIDPQTPMTLYAGTETGVFRSTNGGDSWTDFNDGLTNRRVGALAISATTLVAGTGGGAFSIALRQRYDLTVATAGDGAGTVTSNPPGITCGTDCAESYASGTMITLTAAPASNSVFAGWSGCDSVDGTSCTVAMNGSASVTARFDRQRFTLTASKSGLGRGTVTSSPSGISCGTDCSESYLAGTSVTLTATPALGSIFMEWRGCDAVSGARCTVTMNRQQSVTASFLGVRLTLSIGSALRP
jgi:hypothetical protein